MSSTLPMYEPTKSIHSNSDVLVKVAEMQKGGKEQSVVQASIFDVSTEWFLDRCPFFVCKNVIKIVSNLRTVRNETMQLSAIGWTCFSLTPTLYLCWFRFSDAWQRRQGSFLSWQENYLKTRTSLPPDEVEKNPEYHLMERMSRAAESISDSDLINSDIRKNQLWSLLPCYGQRCLSFLSHLICPSGTLATVKAGFPIRGIPPAFYSNELWRKQSFTKVRRSRTPRGVV